MMLVLQCQCLCHDASGAYVNHLLAISIQDFDNSGEPGPHAKGVNHLETTSHNYAWLLGAAIGCVDYAVRLCMCESRYRWLAAWVIFWCVLIHSSMLWLLPVTLL